MKRLIFSAALFVFIVQCVSAINLFKKGNNEVLDYKAWADTAGVARQVDGIRLYYPETKDNVVTISGSVDIPQKSASQLFLGALDYAAEHIDTSDGHEALGEINSSDMSFTVRLYTKQGANNTETIVTRLVHFKAGTGKISFVISEIDIKHRDRGIIPRTQSLEKLNPATNKRHRELVEIAVENNSRYIDALVHAAASAKGLSVTHWDEIKNHEVIKGMNPLEVKLSIGKPTTMRDNGDRVRWVYPMNHIVLFEKGIVSRVLD